MIGNDSQVQSQRSEIYYNLYSSKNAGLARSRSLHEDKFERNKDHPMEVEKENKSIISLLGGSGFSISNTNEYRYFQLKSKYFDMKDLNEIKKNNDNSEEEKPIASENKITMIKNEIVGEMK